MNYVPEEALKGVAVIGEVSLEGKIRGVSGVLPIVMELRIRLYCLYFAGRK